MGRLVSLAEGAARHDPRNLGQIAMRAPAALCLHVCARQSDNHQQLCAHAGEPTVTCSRPFKLAGSVNRKIKYPKVSLWVGLMTLCDYRRHCGGGRVAQASLAAEDAALLGIGSIALQTRRGIHYTRSADTFVQLTARIASG